MSLRCLIVFDKDAVRRDAIDFHVDGASQQPNTSMTDTTTKIIL